MPRCERIRSGGSLHNRAGPIRCAIYTRKSSDEGLEQEFNSLDAQREACEAFIISQRHEGWIALPDMYDDGGLSGGSMERPALKRLLADIVSGKIDTIVVYKVDRLTRSLADFAKIVDILDSNKASFVSVTQQFNTTTSMGRLTLNMLLSFAQFEREIAGERIRDKIAASKARGMWMGGNVPLGYDAIDRKLVINDAEAASVRTIFERYIALGSVPLLRQGLDRLGIVSKRRINTSGFQTGGQPFSRGPLYALLQNPVYIGKIVHRGQVYEGQHEAIINQQLWDEVQEKLAQNRTDRNLGTNKQEPSLLAGLVRDETGHLMTPSHANKKSRRYRYYVSTAINDPDPTAYTSRTNRDDKPTEASPMRIPANDLESVVFDRLHQLLATPTELAEIAASIELKAASVEHMLKSASDLADRWTLHSSHQRRAMALTVIERIDVAKEAITLVLNRVGLIRFLGIDKHTDVRPIDPLAMTIPAQLCRSGKGKRIVINGEARQPDPALVRMLQKAFAVRSDVLSGNCQTLDSISVKRAIPNGQATALLRLSWLSPSIIRDIMDGRQPPAVTPNTMLRGSKNLPVCWNAQRVHLGFDII